MACVFLIRAWRYTYIRLECFFCSKKRYVPAKNDNRYFLSSFSHCSTETLKESGFCHKILQKEIYHIHWWYKKSANYHASNKPYVWLIFLSTTVSSPTVAAIVSIDDLPSGNVFLWVFISLVMFKPSIAASIELLNNLRRFLAVRDKSCEVA